MACKEMKNKRGDQGEWIYEILFKKFNRIV